MVGVSLLGLPHGQVVVFFTLTIEIRPLIPWLEFLVYVSFLSIFVYYDGWFHLLYCTLYHGSEKDDVIYYYKCIFFWPFIPYDM